MHPVAPLILVALSLSGAYTMVLPNNSDIVMASSWRPHMFSLPRIHYNTGDEDPPGNLGVFHLADNTSITGPLLMAYYPDWTGDEFPPEKIDFSRFDWIDFAFAVPDKSFALTWDDPDVAPDLLRRLVNLARLPLRKIENGLHKIFCSCTMISTWMASTSTGNILAIQEKPEIWSELTIRIIFCFSCAN